MTTRLGSSIIVQPVVGQSKPTITTSSQQALRRLQVSKSDVDDPGKLVSWLQRLQENVALALRPLAQNPLASSNILRGVVFTSGQTQYLAHALGRPYQGWICCRAQGAAASFVEVALPSGATAAQVLPLLAGSSGTFDLCIF